MIFRKTGWIQQLGELSYEAWSGFLSLSLFVGSLTLSIWKAVKKPRSIRWRETFYYMNSCGVDGLPITILICFLTGIILGYQSAVQMQKYGAEVFLPMLVGCSIVRELGPIMVAIVATGRSGSAFAAEIGTMKISEELDAMKTMGFDPIHFLVIPKLIAMITMIPLLTMVGNLVGVLGGFLVGYSELGMPFETYLNLTQEGVDPKYVFEGLFKSVIFAVIITVTGCWRGFNTGSDAIAVGRSTTSAVVFSILFIIIADTVLAKFFSHIFNMGG